MAKLILVRHGQSRWNLQNKFTGWVDIPLSNQGIQEAQTCAEDLKDIKMDIAFTSDLIRAQSTLLIILAKQDKTGIFLHSNAKRNAWLLNSNKLDVDEIPIHETFELNERYYGDLQGMDKDEARKKYGEDLVTTWRRSFAVRPPNGESLKDVYERVMDCYTNKIIHHLNANQNVIICAHGNSLRALLKNFENISDDDVVNLEFATGKALVYDYKEGVLTNVKDGISFNRKTYWEKPKSSK